MECFNARFDVLSTFVCYAANYTSNSCNQVPLAVSRYSDNVRVLRYTRESEP